MNRPEDLRAKIEWVGSGAQDELRFRWGRHEGGFVGEWEGLLRVHVDAAGSILSRVPLTDDPQVRKLAEGPSTAFARFVAGRLSLHASAVAAGDSAILLVGAGGSGKSTLAYRVCAEWQADLLADDVAAVDVADDGWLVRPTESSSWLLGPGGTKRPIPALHPARGPAKLRCIVGLAFDESLKGVKVRRVRGSAAFGVLLSAPMRFRLGAATWRGEFDALTALGKGVPVLTLARPHELDVDIVALCLDGLLRAGPPEVEHG